VVFGAHRKPEATLLPYATYERYEALARQRERLDWALSAAQSVRIELPGPFSPEHDRKVSAYVDGEFSAAEVYQRTVAGHRTPPPRPPGVGWQRELLPVLAGLAAEDSRISDLRAHGSANGAAAVDRWSDLDVLVTAVEPAEAAEDLARRIADHVAPVFAASRSATDSGYGVRLVLADLRRVDISAVPPQSPGGTGQAGEPRETTEPGHCQEPGGAVAEIADSFRFDAVLAAVKAARGDVLIGAHLTLQLARHVLVLAMLLRDRDAGTNHHRHGGSRWDQWAARLTAAPAPYDKAGITAAIRFYLTMLDEILACWPLEAPSDHSPLLALLDAVDRYGAGEDAQPCPAEGRPGVAG